MTHVFDAKGAFAAVTALEVGPCFVLAVGDKNVQLGFGQVKQKHLKKPQAGMFKKINVSPCKFIREVEKEAGQEYKIGDQAKVDLFKEGDFVDVAGISLGKGFQGGMKRWHWQGGPKTHGSTSHRRIGSIGSSTTPGRVWKGHHLPGHMGAVRVTSENLKIIKVDAEKNIMLVNGSVPGHKDSLIVIRKAKKKVQKVK